MTGILGILAKGCGEGLKPEDVKQVTVAYTNLVRDVNIYYNQYIDLKQRVEQLRSENRFLTNEISNYDAENP